MLLCVVVGSALCLVFGGHKAGQLKVVHPRRLAGLGRVFFLPLMGDQLLANAVEEAHVVVGVEGVVSTDGSAEV